MTYLQAVRCCASSVSAGVAELWFGRTRSPSSDPAAEVHERRGAGVENRLHLVMWFAVGAGRPPADHLVQWVGLRGTLDIDRVGLVDGAGGKTPKLGGMVDFVSVADDGEHLRALAQPGGVPVGLLRALVKRVEQLCR